MKIIYTILKIVMYKGRLESSYDDIIPAVDDFFDQKDPSTATLMEEVCINHKKDYAEK